MVSCVNISNAANYTHTQTHTRTRTRTHTHTQASLSPDAAQVWHMCRLLEATPTSLCRYPYSSRGGRGEGGGAEWEDTADESSHLFLNSSHAPASRPLFSNARHESLGRGPVIPSIPSIPAVSAMLQRYEKYFLHSCHSPRPLHLLEAILYTCGTYYTEIECQASAQDEA